MPPDSRTGERPPTPTLLSYGPSMFPRQRTRSSLSADARPPTSATAQLWAASPVGTPAGRCGCPLPAAFAGRCQGRGAPESGPRQGGAGMLCCSALRPGTGAAPCWAHARRPPAVSLGIGRGWPCLPASGLAPPACAALTPFAGRPGDRTVPKKSKEAVGKPGAVGRPAEWDTCPRAVDGARRGALILERVPGG